MDLSMLLACLPSDYGLYAALLIVICKVITSAVQPPGAGSRWARPYQLINMMALNIGWATNRLQVGRTGIMVPRDQRKAATRILKTSGVPVADRAPDT